MSAPKDPTAGRSPPPNTDGTDATARRAALSALVHRLNGSLNNASLAFEVALGAERDAATELTLRTGLAAISQASRAAMLLAYLVSGERSESEPSELYLNDVRELLADYARATGWAASPQREACANTPAEAVRLLVAELARLARS